MFNKEFLRRLRLFAVGAAVGSIILYFLIWKENRKSYYQWPSEIIKERIQTRPLVYTQHAECRMKCRAIDKTDIREIMMNGTINYSKSEVHDKPCPSYALEGKTSDGQNLRIVFATCDSIIKVITAIDLNLDKGQELCDCK